MLMNLTLKLMPCILICQGLIKRDVCGVNPQSEYYFFNDTDDGSPLILISLFLALILAHF